MSFCLRPEGGTQNPIGLVKSRQAKRLRNVVDAIDSAAKAAGYPAKIVSNKFQHAAIFWPVRGISCPLLADH